MEKIVSLAHTEQSGNVCFMYSRRSLPYGKWLFPLMESCSSPYGNFALTSLYVFPLFHNYNLGYVVVEAGGVGVDDGDCVEWFCLRTKKVKSSRTSLYLSSFYQK